MNEKKCARCEQTKTVDCFKSLKTARDGLNSWCIDCRVEYNRTRYSKNSHVPSKPKLVAQLEGHKVCRKCAQEKPFIEFAENKKIKCGLNSWCRACVNAYANASNKAKSAARKLLQPPKEVLPEGQKRCTSCDEIKTATLEFFRFDKDGRNGLESRCKVCYIASQKAYRERERENIRKRYCNRRVLKPKEQYKTITRWLVDGKEPVNKLCGGPCKLNKPVEEFSIRGKKVNGKPRYKSKCQQCILLYFKLDRIKNPERVKVRADKAYAVKKAIRDALRVLELQPKEGHIFCNGCKAEKLFTIEFFEKCFVSKSGLKMTCRTCVIKEKQKHTKRHLSDKYGYRFCNHCDQELVLNEFKTEGGTDGFVCKACRINSDKTNRELMFNNARSRLRNFLYAPSERYSDEMGCTNKELRSHLENQFKSGMTWENQGSYWHLDHYYPLSKAFEHSLEAYAKARHFTNIRPVEAIKNLKKHANIPKEYLNIEDFLKDWIPPKPKQVKTKKAFSWD